MAALKLITSSCRCPFSPLILLTRRGSCAEASHINFPMRTAMASPAIGCAQLPRRLALQSIANHLVRTRKLRALHVLRQLLLFVFVTTAWPGLAAVL
eukprot:611772-Karenia_brevis.AAC.2